MNLLLNVSQRIVAIAEDGWHSCMHMQPIEWCPYEQRWQIFQRRLWELGWRRAFDCLREPASSVDDDPGAA